jgi:hypothetical protein
MGTGCFIGLADRPTAMPAAPFDVQLLEGDLAGTKTCTLGAAELGTSALGQKQTCSQVSPDVR